MNTTSRREFCQYTGMLSLALMGLPLGQAHGQVRDQTQGQANGRRRPNILFVLTDQWRATAMGYAGDPNARTPHLDRLQKQSVHFANAVSVHPICTPARAALLTGQFPTTNGVFHNDVSLDPSALGMGDLFRDAGYRTGYIGKWHVDGQGRQSFIPPERRHGFEYWKVAECDHDYYHSHYYAGEDTTKRYWEGYDAYAQTRDACQYIRDHAAAEQPFLLVLSYGGPHFPHEPSPPEHRRLYAPEKIQLPPNVPEEMRAIAQFEACGYYAHCAAIDQCVGDLLRQLDDSGIAEETIVVFTSDHGEMMGSHGVKPRKKKWPYDESIRVPFLLRHPGAGNRQGRAVTAPINTPDILPTLMGLCGIPVPASIQGENLALLANGAEADRDRAALIMSVSHVRMDCPEYRGIRTARHTFVRNLEGPWLLYDNQADPHQMNNLAGRPEAADLQADLDARLRQELQRIGDELRPRQYYLDKWRYAAAGVINE